MLLKCPKYSAYKLLDGRNVGSAYGNSVIVDRLGNEKRYSFPNHSAGPFGNDIDEDWLDKSSALKKVLSSRLGWRDLHASAVDKGSQVEYPTKFLDHLSYQYNGLKLYVPNTVKSAFRALRN